MKNTLILLFFIILTSNLSAQNIKNDSIIIVYKNPNKGFYSDYILFLPKGIEFNQRTTLLIEPNNTGRTSDSIEVHKKYAIDLASVSSVGNNISTMLKIPLLVPIFPRPSSKALVYTHALDRDVILDKTSELARLDLQLLKMVDDAKEKLNSMNIKLNSQFFMSGFSASATFINRFSFIHPEKIKALAIGGFNGMLMIPLKKLQNQKLNYPVGINDFEKMFSKEFDFNTYKSIPQFIYMGKLDQNDAVQYDDAYNDKERNIINKTLTDNVQNRYLECKKNYDQNNINAIFKAYEDVGHWTTSEINFEIIKFFFKELQNK